MLCALFYIYCLIVSETWEEPCHIYIYIYIKMGVLELCWLPGSRERGRGKRKALAHYLLHVHASGKHTATLPPQSIRKRSYGKQVCQGDTLDRRPT